MRCGVVRCGVMVFPGIRPSRRARFEILQVFVPLPPFMVYVISFPTLSYLYSYHILSFSPPFLFIHSLPIPLLLLIFISSIKYITSSPDYIYSYSLNVSYLYSPISVSFISSIWWNFSSYRSIPFLIVHFSLSIPVSPPSNLFFFPKSCKPSYEISTPLPSIATTGNWVWCICSQWSKLMTG